jgi:hypothetical protein
MNCENSVTAFFSLPLEIKPESLIGVNVILGNVFSCQFGLIA